MRQWYNAIQQMRRMGMLDFQIARILGVKTNKITRLKIGGLRKVM